MAWKKIINSSDDLSGLSDVNYTGNTADGTPKIPAKNDTLIFDGSDWVAVPAGTEFNFAITSFLSADVTENGTYEMGVEGASFKGAMDFTAAYFRTTEVDFPSDPAVALSGSSHSSNSGFPLDMVAAGTSSDGTGVLKYPDSAWGSGTGVSAGTRMYKFTLTADEDGGGGEAALTSDFNVTFKNRIYYGMDDAAVPSNGETIALSKSYVANSYALSEKTLTLNGSDNYIHVFYPSRISGTPIFKVDTFIQDLELVGTGTITNSTSYPETFKHYRSGQTYNSNKTIEIS